MELFTDCFNSPFGDIMIAVDEDNRLHHLHFLPDNEDAGSYFSQKGMNVVRDKKLCSLAVKQLEEYFSGKRHEFELEVAPEGTPFQLKVWKELQRIPYGVTISYGELASRIGKPTASRAVGLANGKNPISIVIPCHRVIGADGSLTGYGGGLHRKQGLLELEGAITSKLF
ncbi:MAG: methylated-DNA--[protein]-cysteine S-methyltransferase [Candidatus Electryonea clarkiae]|nr:methylated-DNA--[protein]-cysteine S-methyltransferase [Candidatus Electryonea clarkiae]MDP8285941.1 methylated-DNA--[protein]-cysteine S-methyltransferase [Candidatus Electryonea clarkiae]